MKYKSTSILFYGKDTHKDYYVLLGYQNRLKAYSDFGGQRKSAMDRDYYDTALRELLEEWFGWTVIPLHFIDQLVNELEENVEMHVKNDTHILFILDIQQLENILKRCKNIDRNSDYYTQFPINYHDLLDKRRAGKKATVSKLEFFNIQDDKRLRGIDPNAYEDIERLRKILDRRTFHLV